MKRGKLKKIVTAVLTLAMTGALLCGCGGSKGEEITITFMNGEDTLGTVTATAGELVTGYEQYETVDGFEFQGWFEAPTFLEASAKDLTKDTFDEDTTLYGDFLSTDVEEDTRSWYIVGTGKSQILADGNWADSSATDDVKAEAQLQPTGNATNEFAITLDLYKGDQYQLVADWSWDTQYGFGYFTDIDDTQMENGGGLSGSTDTANVNVIMDGNYTITLTTVPGDDAQTIISVVRNGDPEGAAAESEDQEFTVDDKTTVSVKGSWVDDWSELKELTREDGTNTYSIQMDLTAGTELYFSIFEDGEDTGLGLKGENVTDDASKALLSDGDNVVVAADGTYTFTVDLDAMTVTVTQ